MDGSLLAGLELLLVLGGVLGWGAWELYTLRRAQRRGPERPKRTSL